MARQKKNAFDRCAVTVSTDVRLHIRSLRLETPNEYLRWCRKYGFTPSLHKSRRVLKKEYTTFQRRGASKALAQSRQFRNPVKALTAVLRGDARADDVGWRSMTATCQRMEALAAESAHREHLPDVIAHIHRRMRFLFAERRFGTGVYPYLDAVVVINACRDRWLRPLEAFNPRTRNTRRQFSALVRHLFVQYDVPLFLDAAWFRQDELGASARDWFIAMGRGTNLRRLETPVSITKRMAHEICRAPADLSIEGAFRWAQVHVGGGGPGLARAVVHSAIGESFDNDPFWQSVIRFFVRCPRLRMDQVSPLIDYIRFQRFEPYDVRHADGSVETLSPPRPHLSMKRRKLEPLLVEMKRWHRYVAAAHGSQTWNPSSIASFVFDTGRRENGTFQRFAIRELTTSKALAAEGSAMRHCVGSYARSCSGGQSSIWSLRLENAARFRRLLTIEVRGKSIVQARGKGNRKPTQKSAQIVRRWADREGLTIVTPSI